MTIRIKNAVRDESGRAPLRLALASCLLAIAFATGSPAFETNPLVGKAIGTLRNHLPATLDRLTKAMGG